MKTFNFSLSTFLAALTITTSQFLASCQKEEEPTQEMMPTITDLEIGSGNNQRGVIGRDFHLDMDVTAGHLIESIQIRIEPKDGEVYEGNWSFELTWEDEYQGVKNTNVHKHFTIPHDAFEGDYNFIIVVRDQNGMLLEQVESITLISAEALPVDPELYSYMVQKNKSSYVYILNRGYMDPEDKGFSRGDTLNSFIDIRNTKDDGILYLVLIKKSMNYRPESAVGLDFSKVIVADVIEHKNVRETGYFLNYGSGVVQPDFVIGADRDNNSQANAISGDKEWENGDYVLGVLYTNTTSNMNVYYYIDLKLDGFS